MIEKTVNIDISGKAKMPTFVVYPSDEDIYPVVFLLMDAPGIRQELHDMASRIASCGYYVLCPNLYYRSAKPFKWNKPNLNFIEGLSPESSRELMFENMDKLSNELILGDINCMIEFCDGQSSAKSSSVGLVGYCMSGPFAFYAAGKLPGRVAAAASIHGVKLITEKQDSPHLFSENVKGELYFGCAETDSYAPLEMIDALEKHLSATSVDYKIEVFPETHHGFAFPNRGQLYSRAHAETHWFRILDLFSRKLK